MSSLRRQGGIYHGFPNKWALNHAGIWSREAKPGMCHVRRRCQITPSRLSGPLAAPYDLHRRQRFALKTKPRSGGDAPPDQHRNRVLGFLIIAVWQVLALNLYKWDDWSKAKLARKLGSYNFLVSMIYCLCGVLIIVLRVVPRRLVSLRQQAWQILVKKSVTRGCPQWYRPFASSTIALWLDNSLTVMYISWACRLIFRIMPWMLEALNMIMPFWTTSRWQPIGFASGSQVSDAVYDNLMSVMRKLRVAALVALFSRMLLNLKDPNLSPSQIPMEPGQATKGATIVWRPLVWLMGMRVRPRLRTSNMRLLLADKCLTGAIYMLLLAVPLRLVNVQLRTVLAVGGVGGLAVGLALQNLVQNLISGILIYTNATICEGLEVELQDVNLQGVINEVGWFNTTVNGYGGARVTVPNRRILDGTVVDKTNKRYRVCQAKLVVVFEDPGKLEALVNAVEKDLRNNPNVLQSSSVLQIRMVNRGHIKIYEPQFCLTGWSPYGANFFLRAYMDKSLQGDVFLKYQSKLMIDVTTRIKQFGGRLGGPFLPLPPEATLAKPEASEK
ncbi:unnamed protein product [Effrenium voratum]|nr:unnamed protein product [Effrenium voratum]